MTERLDMLVLRFVTLHNIIILQFGDHIIHILCAPTTLANWSSPTFV